MDTDAHQQEEEHNETDQHVCRHLRIVKGVALNLADEDVQLCDQRTVDTVELGVLSAEEEVRHDGACHVDYDEQQREVHQVIRRQLDCACDQRHAGMAPMEHSMKQSMKDSLGQGTPSQS